MISTTLFVSTVLGQVELPSPLEPLERLQGIISGSSSEDDRRRQTIVTSGNIGSNIGLTNSGMGQGTNIITSNNKGSTIGVNNVGQPGVAVPGGTFIDTSGNSHSNLLINNGPGAGMSGTGWPFTGSWPFTGWPFTNGVATPGAVGMPGAVATPGTVGMPGTTNGHTQGTMTGHIQDTTWPIIPATDQWAGPIPLHNWPTTGHTHGTPPGHNRPTPGGNTNNWPTPGTTHSWPTSTNIQTTGNVGPNINLLPERLARGSFPWNTGHWNTGSPNTWSTGSPNTWNTGSPNTWNTGSPNPWNMGSPNTWKMGSPHNMNPGSPSTSITADGNLWSTVDVTNNPGSYPWNVDISADENLGSDVGIFNSGSGTISAGRNTDSTIRINNHGRRLSFLNTGYPNMGFARPGPDYSINLHPNTGYPNNMNGFPSTSITADGNLWSTVDVTNNPGSYPWNVDISADENLGADVGIFNSGSGTISADRNTGGTIRINNHGRRLEDRPEGDLLDELEAPVHTIDSAE